jgi:hypothetical protein
MQNVDDSMHIWESPDDANWSSATPADYSVPAQRATGYPQQILVSAHGKAYLLGQDESTGAIQIWTSNKSTFSSGYQLPQSPPSLPLGLVDTGTCVVAAVLQYTKSDTIDGVVAGNASPRALESWSLCGGQLSAQPAVLSLPDSAFNTWDEFHIVRDGSTAEVIDNDARYVLRSGVWSRAAYAFPDAYLLLSNENAAVNVDGSDYWVAGPSGKVSTGRLPAGQLPDAGVATGDGPIVAGCAVTEGFVVGGSTLPPGGKEVAAIWWSPDGHTWHKMPVLRNSLQRLNRIIGTACAPDGTVLIIGETFSADRSATASAWTESFTR